MTTATSGHLSGPQGPEGDQGLVVSMGAGRLLFALLLSPAGTANLSRLANIPTKSLQVYIDELIAAEVQDPDPEDMTTPIGVGLGREGPRPEGVELTDSKPLEASIPQRYDKKPAIAQLDPSNPIARYRVEDPESELEAACMAADQIEAPVERLRAQAIAVIDAWRLFFPEVNKVQELQPRKAKEWVKLAGSAFPGHEATTVFGWLGGVEEKYLLTREFPLGTVNKIINNKAEEAKKHVGNGGDGLDGWREYAQKIIEQGGNNHHGPQDSGGTLLRIAGRVKSSTKEPS